MTNYDPPGHGWFTMPGRQKGVRTVYDQVIGLEALAPYAGNASVLDLGCAEGLIGFWLLDQGARHVDGIEVVKSRVETARKLAKQLPPGKSAAFHIQWLDDFAAEPPALLRDRYDIVLLLSIAQKMRDPAAFVLAAARRCTKALAIRQPHPVIEDRRSDHVPVDCPALLAAEGFHLLAERRVPNDRGETFEWCAVFARR